MSQKNNLRKLSIAYANGQIDSKYYRRIRSQQLSALDFQKRVPPLPEELAKIQVPGKAVDIQMESVAVETHNQQVFKIAAGVVVSVILIAIAFWWFS